MPLLQRSTSHESKRLTVLVWKELHRKSDSDKDPFRWAAVVLSFTRGKERKHHVRRQRNADALSRISVELQISTYSMSNSLLLCTLPMPTPAPCSSSSSSSSSSFMGIKKSRRRGSVDELALAKAAAWAWYERGSGSAGKPIREYDVTRTRRAPGPSRYKHEAMKLAQLAKVRDDKERETEKEKENSLMDPYEVRMISRQLDRFIESRRIYDDNYYPGSADVGLHHDHRKYGASSPESERSRGSKMRKKKKKKSLGFWQKHGVMCATRGDVVEASVLREARSRHNKHVPVVR